MEPLCTIPEYRHKGLAAAALSEMYRKTKALGATHMTGGSGRFYQKTYILNILFIDILASAAAWPIACRNRSRKTQPGNYVNPFIFLSDTDTPEYFAFHHPVSDFPDTGYRRSLSI